MNKHDDIKSRGSAPRVLLFSQRNIYQQEVWRCAFHEFEGILQDIDAVNLVAPKPRKWFEYGKRVALRAGRHFKVPLNPGIPRIQLDRDYDVFLAVCEKPSELLNLNAAQGWKDRCRTSVCWLTEFYVTHIPLFKSSLEILSKFDHVLFMTTAFEPFKGLVRGKCSYLPAGIDSFLFCPFPRPPKRSIDVYSFGRRSEETHQALLRMAREEGVFYVFDTIRNLHAYNIEHHRALVADTAKRSRYVIVNPGKINVPQETGGQSEFGHRYFEGAAPGAILLGERPKNKEFEKIFNWEDAVIDLPFGCDQVGAIIGELDKQPERQMKIRRNNILQSLRHFDWAYRWEAILGMAGLEPLPGLIERKEKLKALAAVVEQEPIEP